MNDRLIAHDREQTHGKCCVQTEVLESESEGIDRNVTLPNEPQKYNSHSHLLTHAHIHTRTHTHTRTHSHHRPCCVGFPHLPKMQMAPKMRNWKTNSEPPSKLAKKPDFLLCFAARAGSDNPRLFSSLGMTGKGHVEAINPGFQKCQNGLLEDTQSGVLQYLSSIASHALSCCCIPPCVWCLQAHFLLCCRLSDQRRRPYSIGELFCVDMMRCVVPCEMRCCG